MHEVVGGGRGEGGLLLLGLGHDSLMVGTSPASAPPAPSPFILGKGGGVEGREARPRPQAGWELSEVMCGNKAAEGTPDKTD